MPGETRAYRHLWYNWYKGKVRVNQEASDELVQGATFGLSDRLSRCLLPLQFVPILLTKATRHNENTSFFIMSLDLCWKIQPKPLDLMKRLVLTSRSVALVEKSRLALVENCSKRNHLALEEGVMIRKKPLGDDQPWRERKGLRFTLLEWKSKRAFVIWKDFWVWDAPSITVESSRTFV
jgi:hypothetical protein